jgi:5-methylcytosine-specific restriction protein A
MARFIVGQVYRRRDLHQQYGGQQQGGISTPAASPTILIFTGDQGEQYGYGYDGFQEDGSYWYTGEGQVGDMQILRGNLAILEHERRGKELHLFQYVSSGMVQYVGRAYCVGYHHAPSRDRPGNLRQAIVFELVVDSDLEGTPGVLPAVVVPEPAALWRRDLSDLRNLAIEAAAQPRSPSERKISAYYRSEAVKVYVLRRAKGFCEGCKQPAPFMRSDKRPYLEPHHIRRRADAGPDHPAWVIALCPNCHKRVHYGADGREFNATLQTHVAELENRL